MLNSDDKLIDNVISKSYADEIQNDILQSKFPFYYISDVTNANYGDNSGWYHLLFNVGTDPTPWFPFMKPLALAVADAIEQPISQLLRMRIGLLTPGGTTEFNTPHIDFATPHHTVCYYVNDSDGDTVVFDQTMHGAPTDQFTEKALLEHVVKTNFTIAARASPKKGSICSFDGMRFHASSTPKISKRRVVITINYVPQC